MHPIQIISGTKIKIEGQVFSCQGFWSLGNKITSYIFKSELGTEFTRDYDKVQELLKTGVIEKI